MVPDDDKPRPPDPKVKDLVDRNRPLDEVVDAATAAELARWFGMPSFEQLEEKVETDPDSTLDPDVLAVRERRARVLQEIDPALLGELDHRHERAWKLLGLEWELDTKLREDMTFFDPTMVDRLFVVAEPREMVQPEDLEDDLKDRTPQALLRDLHRSVSYFDKLFEVVDAAAEQTLDIVAEVNAAMATDWKLPPLGDPPSEEFRKVSAELRAEQRQPWSTLPKRVNMVNRRITE